MHSHSDKSPDGGIDLDEYLLLFTKDKLDYIAITDHDSISGAVKAQKRIGERIIIGQEITTKQGEIIGLFINTKIKPGQDAFAAAKEVKEQGGLVYIPHPFETVRQGISKETLNGISDLVDIVEVFNGRAVFQNKGPEAATWAKLNNKVTCASSDAHGILGIGTCYTTISEPPTAANLVKQLRTAKLTTMHPPLYTLLYPKLNRLRGKLKLKN